ncbi:transmembrane protein 186 [Drosophila albomicans]|uniref:Transmembrane protein 186 n=1 Tax=Drosophila albomicans TaxID=7291 RepID=A0A6P8X8R9_DROAB|nr:transmembrane protein 186 [Drosophila albomicans]
MLQRFCRPRFIKLPLTYCAGSRRHSANTPATEPATATSSAVKTATTKKLAVEDGFTDWRPIYQLPLIRWIAAFNRLKNYQAAVTLAATPLAFTLSQAGQVSGEAIGICASLGVSGLITLSLGSYLTSNIIGFIYINDQQDQLRLAYVDFWGRRQEALVDIEDILPDWELKRTTRLGFYQPICLRTDKKQRFKILQRFGVITDPLIFEGLFGQ